MEMMICGGGWGEAGCPCSGTVVQEKEGMHVLEPTPPGHPVPLLPTLRGTGPPMGDGTSPGPPLRPHRELGQL